MRGRSRLTTIQVRTAKHRISASGRPYAAMIPDGGGLYLRVDPKGARSWVFRYKIDGHQRDLGLGSALDFSLAEARERALAARKLVADGIDPVDAKKGRKRAAVAGVSEGNQLQIVR